MRTTLMGASDKSARPEATVLAQCGRGALRGVAVVALLLVGLPAALAAPESITVSLPGDVPSLDPSKDSSPLGANYRINVFDALTQLERDGSVSPRLALSWSSANGLKEWTVKLRPGVKFHDGSDFTASDVVFTVERVLADATSPLRQFVKLITKVEKVDDLTLRFTLEQPFAIFPRQLSYTYIMSKIYFDKVGNEGYASRPVGSGPYRLVSWTKDDRMVLEANPNYWRGAPAIKKATFRPIPSEVSRANALLAGDIDVVPSLPPALVAQLKSAPNLKVETAPGFQVGYLALDPNKAPMSNPLIREAVDKAIDRKAITERLMRGYATPTGSMLPPSNFGYDATVKPVAYDPAAARELVRKADYRGEPISIQYPNNDGAMSNELVQAIAGFLTAAGLKVDVRGMQFTAFFPLWLQAKLDNAYFFTFGSSQYHAENVLSLMFAEGAHAYKVNPETDKLVRMQRAEADPEKQKQLIGEAFRIGREDRYYLPIYNTMWIYAAKKSIDFTPFPDGVVRLYTIQ